MANRREFTKKTQREALKRSGMKCEAVGAMYGLETGKRCEADLAYGVEFDHIVLDANSKDNSLENCAAVCIKCHRWKTAKHDIPMAAKTVRMEDRAGIVEDHKAVFAERYAKTEQDLLGDIPMMIYGGYLFSIEPELKQVTLRHNQFMQDTLAVRHVEVIVSRANCRAFWGARIMPLLATMDANRTVEQWADVPGQPRLSKACTNYGGCPFNLICHGGLPIEQFAGETSTKEGAPF